MPTVIHEKKTLLSLLECVGFIVLSPKLIFDEIMMMPALYCTNNLSRIFKMFAL